MTTKISPQQRWLIIGGGISGIGAAAYLEKIGCKVTLSDQQQLTKNCREKLAKLSVTINIGPQTTDLLTTCDGIIVSPGVPFSAPILVAARQKRVPILTEIDLALNQYRGQVVGITGTNGKSTTTVMIEHLLKNAGVTAIAGGNLGTPATELTMPGTQAPDVLLLELSSYQLEQTKTFRATAAVFTSFSHDHMGRHGTLENYFRAKWHLFDGMQSSDLAVMGPEIIPLARKLGCSALKAKTRIYETPADIFADELRAQNILEPHNQLNASFALAVAEHITKKTRPELLPLFEGFRGLPYRFENIGRIHGQSVYNDSKSTNVESVLVALRSVQTPCLLLLGGQSKGEPFAPIIDQHGSQIARILCFGASGREIHDQLQAQKPCVLYPTLAALLNGIDQELRSVSGPIVFSPGCASFDEFDNFEHRGRFFNEQLQSYLD